ncbi:MAG: hypothetical protein LBO21_06775, partial [Synergistaceae bacterium]|nr:hypothetical protein [Synergistaceae bacterium]
MTIQYHRLTRGSPASRPYAADDAGTTRGFASPPKRVVSLLPSVTEVIIGIGASGSLAGVTYDDAEFAGTAGVPIVGGV